MLKERRTMLPLSFTVFPISTHLTYPRSKQATVGSKIVTGSNLTSQIFTLSYSVALALFPGSPEREMYMHGEPDIFSHMIMM